MCSPSPLPPPPFPLPCDRSPAGKGTVIYKNGDKYEGDWASDTRHGLGTLWIFRDGKYKVRYNGEWREDQPTVSQGAGWRAEDSRMPLRHGQPGWGRGERPWGLRHRACL